MTDKGTTQPSLTTLLAQQVQETQELRKLVWQLVDRLDSTDHHIQVKTIDQNIPFWHLVGLLVKMGLAAIPAGIVLSILLWLLALLVGAAVVGY